MSALNYQSQLITPDGNNRTVQYPNLEQPIQYLGIGEIVPDDKDLDQNLQFYVDCGSVSFSQLLSLMKWFASIFVVVHKYNHYYEGYTEVTVKLRSTFWVIMCLLIAQIFLTFLLRRATFIVHIILKNQEKNIQSNKQTYQQHINFVVFTCFISFLLVGIVQYEILETPLWFALLLLGSLTILLIAQIANIKYKIIYLEEKTYFKCVLAVLITLNIILSLCMYEIPSLVLKLELLIPYPIYYFIQLNSSIKDELEVQDHTSQLINQFQNILTLRNNTDEELANAPVPHQDYIMIKKSHIIISLTLIPFAGLIALSILHPYLFTVIGLIVLQLLSVLLPSQIVPNNLNNKLSNEDYCLTIPLIVMDILMPFKNILRSMKR